MSLENKMKSNKEHNLFTFLIIKYDQFKLYNTISNETKLNLCLKVSEFEGLRS